MAHTVRPVWTVAAGLRAGPVIAPVLGDFGGWWTVGAALLWAVQVALFAPTRAA